MRIKKLRGFIFEAVDHHDALSIYWMPLPTFAEPVFGCRFQALGMGPSAFDSS